MCEEKLVDFTTTEPGGMVYLYGVVKRLSCVVTSGDAKYYPELNDGRWWSILDGIWFSTDDDDNSITGITVCIRSWAPKWLTRWLLKVMYWAVKCQWESY